MRHYSLNTIEKLPNLYDYLYTDGKGFHPERMIVELGLYESIKIDVSNISYKSSSTPSHMPGGESIQIITNAYVSEDVKVLHKFISLNDNILLPCPECKKTLAFIPKILFARKESKEELPEKQYDFETAQINRITNSFPQYTFKSDEMVLSKGNIAKVDFERGKEYCVKGITKNISVFKYTYECTLDPNHHIYVYFITYMAINACKKPQELIDYEKRKSLDPSTQMTEKEKEISEKYDKLKYVLILEKVGQEPSMADLQMFDIEKYKSILPKERFRDFSMALGLYASGVGCGSLLYLRRVFESIVITAQLECEKCSEWNKELYESKRFNEKIDYLESLGSKIIPDELSDVKTKIYGFLSKGVHELSEQEAMELFPHLKLAIELILDEQISQKERNEKIKALKKTLNK